MPRALAHEVEKQPQTFPRQGPRAPLAAAAGGLPYGLLGTLSRPLRRQRDRVWRNPVDSASSRTASSVARCASRLRALKNSNLRGSGIPPPGSQGRDRRACGKQVPPTLWMGSKPLLHPGRKAWSVPGQVSRLALEALQDFHVFLDFWLQALKNQKKNIPAPCPGTPRPSQTLPNPPKPSPMGSNPPPRPESSRAFQGSCGFPSQRRTTKPPPAGSPGAGFLGSADFSRCWGSSTAVRQGHRL